MDNSLLHETKIHGTTDFPYIVYHGKIPDFYESFPLHWHDEMEFIYVMEGQLKITVWSTTYTLHTGDIAIILPHAMHSLEQDEFKRAEFFNIVFHCSIFGTDSCYEKYIKPFLTHEKSLSCFERNGSWINEQLKPFLLSLIEHRRNSYTTHEYLVKSHLFMIMHLLNHGCTTSDTNELSRHLTYGKLKAVFYHIQNSYGQDISVKGAAKLCGFSESHFMKLFRELTGMSFTAYLINYRLELAAKQLSETTLNVLEIALNCGFHNPSYFTRSFLKKYGMTPTKFRATMHQN